MSNFHSTLQVVAKVVGQMLFVFGLLGWIYGVALQFRHPASLTYPLSHLTPWIRVDTFTIASFLASAVGFLLWRLVAEAARSSESKTVKDSNL